MYIWAPFFYDLVIKFAITSFGYTSILRDGFIPYLGTYLGRISLLPLFYILFLKKTYPIPYLNTYHRDGTSSNILYNNTEEAFTIPEYIPSRCSLLPIFYIIFLKKAIYPIPEYIS